MKAITVVRKIVCAVRFLYTKFAWLFAGAFLLIFGMTIIDRMYGTNFMAEFISGFESLRLQALATEMMEMNHEAVNAMGAAARTYIPWNHQDSKEYASSIFTVLPNVVQ